MTDHVVCSTDVHIERPTRFVIRIRYGGQVERSTSTVVSSSGPRFLQLWFPNLHFKADPRETWGLPRGRYACEFALGSTRATVPFESGGPTDTVLAAEACQPLGGGDAISPYCSSGTARGRSVACTAVFARLAGHRTRIEIFRGQGDARTLLYAANDVPRVPIEADWAYTSAPAGQLLPLGLYECRFFVDGRLAADTPFEIRE